MILVLIRRWDQNLIYRLPVLPKVKLRTVGIELLVLGI